MAPTLLLLWNVPASPLRLLPFIFVITVIIAELESNQHLRIQDIFPHSPFLFQFSGGKCLREPSVDVATSGQVVSIINFIVDPKTVSVPLGFSMSLRKHT
jgi:hypothetical protein